MQVVVAIVTIGEVSLSTIHELISSVPTGSSSCNKTGAKMYFDRCLYVDLAMLTYLT